ncbi:hypothetical protein FB379_11640 [Aeribacillus composti]|nr:hypothetical protein FB379_11640 [Aeribacillus composti]
MQVQGGLSIQKSGHNEYPPVSAYAQKTDFSLKVLIQLKQMELDLYNRLCFIDLLLYFLKSGST